MQNNESEQEAFTKTLRLMNLGRLVEIYSQQGDDKAAAEAAKEYVALLLGPVCAYCKKRPAKYASTSVDIIDTCADCRVVQ